MNLDNTKQLLKDIETFAVQLHKKYGHDVDPRCRSNIDQIHVQLQTAIEHAKDMLSDRRQRQRWQQASDIWDQMDDVERSLLKVADPDRYEYIQDSIWKLSNYPLKPAFDVGHFAQSIRHNQ